MEKGSYKGRRVDFEKYAASCFNPFLFYGSNRALAGCGACALALLTGTHPATIAARNGGVHYPDEFMVRFLRQYQFKVLKLTLCNLSMPDSEITPEHVLLVSQLFAKNEATWGVISQGLFYHNFRSYNLDSLSLLNKPLLSAYAVVHPRWRAHWPVVEKRTLKSGINSRRFTLAVLGGAKRAQTAVRRSGSKKMPVTRSTADAAVSPTARK